MTEKATKETARSFSTAVPRDLRLLTEDSRVRSVYRYGSGEGSDPVSGFTIEATFLSDTMLPDGYTIVSGGTHSNPNVAVSSYTVRQTRAAE